MYERCLNEAEMILRVRQEPLLPVRKVWEEIAELSKTKGFEIASLSDFSAMLEGDSRFQIIPAQMKIQEDDEILPDPDIEDAALEQLGFFAEDRVKLRSKKNIETIVTEDEEEVGSIRRMSFAGQTVKSKNLSVNKKTATSSKKIASTPKKKKSSPNKSVSRPRTKSIKNKKPKIRARGKK